MTAIWEKVEVTEFGRVEVTGWPERWHKEEGFESETFTVTVSKYGRRPETFELTAWDVMALGYRVERMVNSDEQLKLKLKEIEDE